MIETRGLQVGVDSRRDAEDGWALLGLLLALGVMSIVLASSIVPNVQMQVQRDKELEMIYRGEQMAEGIARYYNGGFLRGINLQQRPPYGYLTELVKLRDGVTIGVREIRFVRGSAMIDPMTSSEWEPIRARDPRIGKFLQAWAAQTLIPIPTQYMLLAGPPTKSVFGKNNSAVSSETSGSGSPLQLTPPSSEQQAPIVNPVNPGNAQPRPGRTPADLDDDEDDDDEINDPLARLFQTDDPGQGNVPIVGVVPKKKGKAANSYYGLDRYEDWVFIFVPKVGLPGQGVGLPIQQQNRQPQVSQ